MNQMETNAAQETSEVQFGSHDASEIELVMDSVAKSFRTSPWAGIVPNHMWFPVCRAAVTGLLERGARVTVARSAGRVLGYILHEEKDGSPVVHFVYVKDWARRQGLAKALLDRVGAVRGTRVFYTHKTGMTKWLAKGYIAVHAPEMARRKAL